MLVIPLFDTIVLPNTKLYLPTENVQDISKREIEVDKKVVILICKKEFNKKNISLDYFYKIGVSGTITEINSNGYIVIETKEKVEIENIELENSNVYLSIRMLNDKEDSDEKENTKVLNKLKKSLISFLNQYQWGILVRSYIVQIKDINELACMMNSWLPIEPEEKYSLLEETSINKRNTKIEKLIREYIELEELSNEAENVQQEEDHKLYREVAIKKQIDYLQKELDELHPENVSEIKMFEEKIKKSGMNEEAEKEATKILKRMEQENSSSPEYGMLYDYLDFMTSLSWKPAKQGKINLKKAEKILDKNHHGLKKVKRRILEQIAVMNLTKKQNGSIILFVGPPGTGKTSIGKSIADALNRKYVRVSLGGSRDEADIRGHRRTYIGAMPGRIMDGIEKSGVSNPVMVLDEVDKLASSYNGDPASALLEVLDPEQNKTFTDHYLNVPYDLSNVLFICTANTTDTIPEPLLNRMEVVEFNGYTPIEKFKIAKNHLIPSMIEDIGLQDKIKISDSAIKLLINNYTMESGVRGLKKVINKLGREVAVELNKEEKELIEITAKTVDNFLDDMKPIHHDRINEIKKPGIVTGLAWTAAGGDILFIETIFTKGKGNVVITGQLGDVMKESVSIAISLVKALFPDKAKLFKDNDLHIHVPEGAVPKDGPSAGITLTTALASLVMKKSVDNKTAMTGEVSLRGVVMPIGGLPEKPMAAERSGIKTVYIPKENLEDLKDVPDEVKQKLEIIPVSNVNEVLKLTKITKE